MKKRFTITENDAGSEAFDDAYVHGLQAALKTLTDIDEWWLQLHDDECPSLGAGEHHPDDCPPELECNCGGDARVTRILDCLRARGYRIRARVGAPMDGKAKLDEARALLEDLRDDPAPPVEDLLEATGLLAEAVDGLPDWVWDRADRRDRD